MIFSATVFPSSQGWRSLEQANLLREISDKARLALEGCVGDSSISLRDYAISNIGQASNIEDTAMSPLWRQINFQARKEFSEQGDQGEFNRIDLKADQHAMAIALCILEKRILEFEKFGFSSAQALANCVSASAELLKCLSLSEEYWINKDGRLTFVSRNIHGDMHISQTQLKDLMHCSGNHERQIDFFLQLGMPDEGDSKEGISTDNPRASLNHFKDWAPLLGSLLVFARKIGLEGVEEIQNYKQVLKELQRCPACTTEVFLGTSGSELQRNLKDYAVLDLADASPPSYLPIQFCASSRENATIYMAVLYDEKLWFPPVNSIFTQISERRKSGNTTEEESFQKQILNLLLDPSMEGQIVRLSKDDLPNALRATYRLFSGSPTDVEAMLGMFLSR